MRRPHDGEAAYWLGRCEQARNDTAAALEAWGRVPASSPFATRAAVGRAGMLTDTGRFAAAEAILEALPRGQDPDAPDVRQALELVYRLQGRMNDVRRLIVESWHGAPDPSAVLRRLFMVDRARYPAATVGKLLAVADKYDDRVWLARANRAILSGQPDEARQWLARCEARRPADPAVWHSYLVLARATGDTRSAFRALEHLPAGHFSAVERSRLRAWLAAASGDPKREKDALDALVVEDPGDTAALDRLAELELARGDTPAAETLHRRKAEIMSLEAQICGPDRPRGPRRQGRRAGRTRDRPGPKGRSEGLGARSGRARWIGPASRRREGRSSRRFAGRALRRPEASGARSDGPRYRSPDCEPRISGRRGKSGPRFHL